MYDLSVRKREQTDMREWLRGGASPCQGEGRGFESRLALLFYGLQTQYLCGFGGFFMPQKSVGVVWDMMRICISFK